MRTLQIGSGIVIGLAVQASMTERCIAVDLLVPGDSPTIQGAIDLAANGDRVLVSAGTYAENINFAGKAIEVRGVDGFGVTAIEPPNLDAVVVFENGEGAGSMLIGFELRHDLTGCEFGNCFARGIRMTNASPVVEACMVRSNAVIDAGCAEGGGILVDGGSPVFRDVIVAFNDASCSGGGVMLDGATATFENCRFEWNMSMGGLGGGVAVWDGSSATFEDCDFWDNAVNPDLAAGTSQGWGGAIGVDGGSMITVTGGTMIRNQALTDGPLECDRGYGAAVLVADGVADLDDVEIRENVTQIFQPGLCPSDDGGAVETIGGIGSATVSNSKFCENNPGHTEGTIDAGGNTFATSCCPADLTGAGAVTTSDLLILLSQWGGPGTADLDGSGVVGTEDLLIMLASWGPC